MWETSLAAAEHELWDAALLTALVRLHRKEVLSHGDGVDLASLVQVFNGVVGTVDEEALLRCAALSVRQLTAKPAESTGVKAALAR